MRTILYFLFVPQLIFSQDLDELSLSILSHHYNDIEHSSIYLSMSGDTIREIKEGQVYTRLDHYKDGSLKAKYKVKTVKELRRDTAMDERKSQVVYFNKNELKDIPFDVVEEYHNPYLIPKSKSKIKKQGQIKDGKIIGTLKYFPRMEDILVTIEYNQDGKIEGSYNEFFNNNGEFTKLKCIGQYGYVERRRFLFNPDVYEYQEKINSELQKMGLWKYYTAQGDLESIQNFNWIKNTISANNEGNNNTIRWKLEAQHLDSLKVNSDSIWYTVYGECKSDSSQIELDYNTYDKSNIHKNINRASIFLSNYSNYKNKYQKYLEQDFQNEGWTYDYIVDYLLHKKYRDLEYEDVTNLSSFKDESLETFKNLKLVRIGFFDINFDFTSKLKEGLYVILDFDIFDSDFSEKLVIKATENGEIKSISVEG